jgi:hypothetical protein
MEYITITLPTERFKMLGLLTSEYTIKSVRVVDDMFKDDETYKQLKKEADEKYKRLEQYCFNKRHGIK